MAGAALVGQKAEKIVHRIEPRGIDHRAALAAHGDERGMAQAVEVKGQGIGCETKFGRDLACGQSARAGADQQPEDFEAVGLRQRGESGDGVYCFHISTNIEILNQDQELRLEASAPDPLFAQDFFAQPSLIRARLPKPLLFQAFLSDARPLSDHLGAGFAHTGCPRGRSAVMRGLDPRIHPLPNVPGGRGTPP